MLRLRVNNRVDMSASIGVAIWLFWPINPLDGISVALYYIDTPNESIASPTSGLHNRSESNRWFTECMTTVEYDADSRHRIFGAMSSCSAVGEERVVHRGHVFTSLRDVLFVSAKNRKPARKCCYFFGVRWCWHVQCSHCRQMDRSSTELHLISVCAFHYSWYGRGTYFFIVNAFFINRLIAGPNCCLKVAKGRKLIDKYSIQYVVVIEYLIVTICDSFLYIYSS